MGISLPATNGQCERAGRSYGGKAVSMLRYRQWLYERIYAPKVGECGVLPARVGKEVCLLEEMAQVCPTSNKR